MDPIVAEWGSLLLRWVHIVAAIAIAPKGVLLDRAERIARRIEIAPHWRTVHPFGAEAT